MEIKTIAEAYKYLYNLSLSNSDFRFRGQANFDWTLIPSIYRYQKFQRYQTVQFEKNVLQAKPPEPNPPLTHTNYEIEWLMIYQHYGIPTRLNDWSADILIALFFACYNEPEEDGALFVCNQNDYPIFASYEDKIMETQKLAFVNTTVNNPRMRAQSGSFMIWGHSPLNEDSTESYDLWEYHKQENKSHFLEKICIPKESKKKIMNELEKIYSINYDNLYLKNGYLEKTYYSDFQNLKEQSYLMTMYVTDADKLTKSQEYKARSMFNIDCRNMFGGCIRLSKIG